MERFATVTPQGREIVYLFVLALAVSGLVLLLVYALLVVILRRDRGRPGDPDPPQVEGNTRLEVLWTATPFVLLPVFFFLTVRTMREVYPESPPAGALRVEVTGRQWWWEFAYPDLGVVTPTSCTSPSGCRCTSR
jgi:cytochrome c oxidase subunit 2